MVEMALNSLLLFVVSLLGVLFVFARCCVRVKVKSNVIVEMEGRNKTHTTGLQAPVGWFYMLIAVLLALPAVFVQGALGASGGLLAYAGLFVYAAVGQFMQARKKQAAQAAGTDIDDDFDDADESEDAPLSARSFLDWVKFVILLSFHLVCLLVAVRGV